MHEKIRIVTAGNTLAPALSLLRQLGFTVTHVRGSDGKRTGLLQAENDRLVVRAEDPVTVLGLVKLVECRGAQWRPTDEEVDDLLRFDEGAV